MLALESLVSGTKLNKVLNGALLPENNNPAFLQVADVHSTTVLFANKESPVQVGFGIALRCSPNQLYCPLISVAKELECGYLNVERMNKCVNGNLGDDVQKRHTFLKINEIHEELPDCSGLPQYFTAFAEPLGRPLLQTIVDQLAVDCFGSTANLELTRNLTVDLYDADSGVKECSDELWRDFAGFLVTDRFRYCELDIKCASLLSALAHKAASLPSAVCIKQLSSATRPLFHDYEQNVSVVVDRTEYLDFVLALNGISGVVAVDETRQPIGYALAIPGRLLQCYADSERVASALLCALFASSSPGSTVSLYLRLGADHSLDSKLLPVADHVRRVRRFHTRIVPTSINWTNVFAPNIGVHLF